MHKSCFLVFLCAGLAGTAAAHDFWLEPDEFRVLGTGYISVTANVGHAEDITEWPANPARIIAFRAVGDDGIVDHQGVFANRRSEGKFEVPMASEGFHVLAIESTPSVSELPAEKFNAYVEDEGVVPIAVHRLENDLGETSGREIYSRRAKAVVAIGDVRLAPDAHITRPAGLTLEITPLTNPLRLPVEADLLLEVRYRGLPLPGATIHVVNLDPAIGDVARIVSGPGGQAVARCLGKGNWMLQTVWSAPIEGDMRGDYDTIFSSLSFSVGGDTLAVMEAGALPPDVAAKIGSGMKAGSGACET